MNLIPENAVVCDSQPTGFTGDADYDFHAKSSMQIAPRYACLFYRKEFVFIPLEIKLVDFVVNFVYKLLIFHSLQEI